MLLWTGGFYRFCKYGHDLVNDKIAGDRWNYAKWRQAADLVTPEPGVIDGFTNGGERVSCRTGYGR